MCRDKLKEIFGITFNVPDLTKKIYSKKATKNFGSVKFHFDSFLFILKTACFYTSF